MSKISVSEFSIKETKTGKTKYVCLGTIDGKIAKFDMWDKPELEKEFEGNVRDDPQWGKSVSTGSSGGGRPQSRANDPETAMQIIRQNALTNAVNFCLGKAAHMEVMDAQRYLSGKQVLQVATYFSRFSQGKVTIVMDPDEIAKEFGYTKAKEEPEEDDLEEESNKPWEDDPRYTGE